ncbi:small multi-drug export protein [Methanoregula sp.]|uniref:small multi-drug export protein n=1 Tax=Methanoregula sp. TaxID=2052170 RepID=UPI00356B5749
MAVLPSSLLPETGIYRRIILLGVPFLVAASHILIMAATLPSAQFLIMLGLMVAYLLPPAGKETVIPIGIALGIPWWYMALSVVMIDVETSLFMSLNFDLAYRIPVIGPVLSGLTKTTGQFIADHHWLAGLWFFSIVLMVMVPVLGSGGVRGSIAGKLLGMNTWLVFLAILTGAFIGCFGMALGSEAILSSLCANHAFPAEIGAQVCGNV